MFEDLTIEERITITYALSEAAHQKRSMIPVFSDSPDGRYLKVAYQQEAEEFDRLRVKLLRYKSEVDPIFTCDDTPKALA